MCENFPDADVKDRCLSTLALRDGNTTICGGVQNASLHEYCVMRVAISKLSEDDCKDETSLREQCVHVVMGLKENNSLVCRLVEDNDTASLCRMRVM
jgi:hypothetical protein